MKKEKGKIEIAKVGDFSETNEYFHAKIFRFFFRYGNKQFEP